MNLLIGIVIIVFLILVAVLVGEIIYMHSRLEYLERRFIDIKGNINYLFNELENKKC